MARRPLLLAAFCALFGAGVYLAVVHVPELQTADLRVFEGFMGLQTMPGAEYADDIVRLFDPAPFAALVLSILALGVLFDRSRAGVLAAGAMLGANVTSQILKPLLAVQRESPIGNPLGPEAWPSGHTTAVMSFALALAIVAPPRWRPLAATVGGVLTVITTFSIIMLGWHYPSDVVGGLLIATAWACLAVIPLRPDERPSLRAPARAAGILAAAAALVVVTRPAAAVDYAIGNTTWLLGALAIAAAALLLSGSVPAPTGARRPRPRD